MNIPIGGGIQGHTDFAQTNKVFDLYLVLENDIGFCQGLGNRAWLRILNHGRAWRNPIYWAGYCVGKIAEVYQYGVRKLIYINEPNLALEGGGESEADYIFLGQWHEEFIPEIRQLLAERGMSDVLLAGPALSPGHQETDGAGYNKHLVYAYTHVDIILAHYYWYRGGGFLNDDDAIHYSRRIEQDMAYLKSLGVPDKPWAVGEFNREVDIHSEADRNHAVDQACQYYDYLAKMGVIGFYFLVTNVDPAFNKLSLSHMPGAMERLIEWKQNRQPIEPQPIPQPEVKPVKKTMIGNLEVIDLRAEFPDRFPPVSFTEKDFISIHHSVSPDVPAQRIFAEHHKKGWGGIGYNFLVHQDGRIEYVGECNTERTAVGQISQGNRRGIHICLLGDFTHDHPTVQQKLATKLLIANIQHAYGWFMPVVPHRIFNSGSEWDTACCGDSYKEWWHELLRAVGE